MKIYVVVPVHTDELWDGFLGAWADVFRELDWDLIPVWDGQDGYKVIDATLGDRSWIIPRRSSAIRSFGILQAYESGADIIVTLDSDTRPLTGGNAIEQHIDNLVPEDVLAWKQTGNHRTRGYPYLGNCVVRRPAISHGTWVGVPDYDAVTQLSGMYDDYKWEADQFVTSQYFPMCGMNVAFTREAAPLMYFGLHGVSRDGEPLPYDRFDDIWCGLIAQKICRHLGLLVRSGNPAVLHERASDPMVNLIKEAPGLPVHEKLWRYVDEIQLTEATPAKCMCQVADELRSFSGFPEDYAAGVSKAMHIWAGLFKE